MQGRGAIALPARVRREIPSRLRRFRGERGGSGGVLSALVAPAALVAVESRGGRELLSDAGSRVARGQLEMHLGAAGTARPACAAPHDTGAAARCDDALSGGHADGRDGSGGPGHAGPGPLILATRARVIPVTIEGMRDVLRRRR